MAVNRKLKRSGKLVAPEHRLAWLPLGFRWKRPPPRNSIAG